MDSKPAADDKYCSGTKNSVSKSTSGASRGTSSGDNGQLHSTPLKSPWPLQNPPPPKYGSLALPIYVFDCSVASLTCSSLSLRGITKRRRRATQRKSTLPLITWMKRL